MTIPGVRWSIHHAGTGGGDRTPTVPRTSPYVLHQDRPGTVGVGRGATSLSSTSDGSSTSSAGCFSAPGSSGSRTRSTGRGLHTSIPSRTPTWPGPTPAHGGLWVGRRGRETSLGHGPRPPALGLVRLARVPPGRVPPAGPIVLVRPPVSQTLLDTVPGHLREVLHVRVLVTQDLGGRSVDRQ